LCADVLTIPAASQDRTRIHHAVIRIYDEAGNVIETHGTLAI